MNEQRAREAVEHVQAAALELIAAVRAVLDVAEDVVRDPGQAAAMAQTLVDTAVDTARQASASRPSGARSDGGSAGDEGVTRIRVS